MLKHSYIVDIGHETFRSAKFNPKANIEGQELFCKCGGRHKYNQKVIREILLSDASLYQSDYDLLSITCPYCNETYDVKNKIRLIDPNIGLLTEVTFYLHKHVLTNGDKVLRLVKQRLYTVYSDFTKSISENKIYDEININLKTKDINIFINNSIFVDLGTKTFMRSTKEKEDSGGISFFLEKNNSNSITFSTLDQLKKFFNFNSKFIIYNNLETAFNFFKEISNDLIDFDKIKNSSNVYMSIFWENSKIFIENKEETDTEKIKRYIYVEDEFAIDGNFKIKQPLLPGAYLMMLELLSFTLFSIQIYPSIITIFTTKNSQFFDAFIKSDVIINPNVLKFHSATNPTKIFETCASYNKNGLLRISELKNNDKEELLDFTKNMKISNIIYQNIYKHDDIMCLKNFSTKNYLTKLQVEQLFQKYSNEEVYTVLGFLGKSEKIDILTFKHIEHIIRYKIYEDVNDFLIIYKDTIKTLNKIVNTQPKVLEHIEKNKNISKKEIEALSVYLSVKENNIFECKNSKDLKRLHDNMSILFSVFQDAAKVERYSLAVKEYEKLNSEIDFFDFEVIPSAFELQREHKIMNHCINTYIDRIIEGNYLAVRVVDKISNEHSTLGLNISGKIIKFDQLKSYSNSLSSPYLISAVLKYFGKYNIQSDTGSQSDINKNNSRSGREGRKDIYPIEKSNELRMKLIKTRDDDVKQEINPQEYNKLIEEFQQLFIEVNKNN